jgi:hypothetical protein
MGEKKPAYNVTVSHHITIRTAGDGEGEMSENAPCGSSKPKYMMDRALMCYIYEAKSIWGIWDGARSIWVVEAVPELVRTVTLQQDQLEWWTERRK